MSVWIRRDVLVLPGGSGIACELGRSLWMPPPVVCDLCDLFLVYPPKCVMSVAVFSMSPGHRRWWWSWGDGSWVSVVGVGCRRSCCKGVRKG